MCYFSIIIPVYNRADIVTQTLMSVSKQSFKDFEVLIVDDGSTDNTGKVVQDFISSNGLKNFKYYHKQNAERGAARNYGIGFANGRYITFLDSDDLIYENHLEVAHYFIMEHKELAVFHQAYEFKNADTGKVRSIEYPKSSSLNVHIIKGNIMSCFGVFLRDDVAKCNLFDDDRRVSGTEDWLLWLKIASRYPILLNQKVTGCMIEHNQRSVLGFKKEQLLERTNLIRDRLYNDEHFIAKFGKKTVKSIYGHMLTYSALHLAMSGKKGALKLFIKGVLYSKHELFTRRTMAFFKNLLTKYG